MQRQPDRTPKHPLRVASVQAVALPGEIERNAETAARLIDEATASGAALIVFPELFLCCYHLALLGRDPSRCDIEADDARLDPIRDACRTGATTAVMSASVLMGDSRSRTISALVIDQHGGLSARYDKQHLWRDERPVFQAGTHACIVDVRGWQLGLGICYDATFPEHARAAALAGADGYLCPSAYRQPTILHPVRALENTIYVVFSNLLGEADGRRFCGRSSIYDPEGEMVADAGPWKEGLAIADFDPAVLVDVRESSPMLQEMAALQTPAASGGDYSDEQFASAPG
jgi:predicted amidohydrolase